MFVRVEHTPLDRHCSAVLLVERSEINPQCSSSYTSYGYHRGPDQEQDAEGKKARETRSGAGRDVVNVVEVLVTIADRGRGFHQLRTRPRGHDGECQVSVLLLRVAWRDDQDSQFI